MKHLTNKKVLSLIIVLVVIAGIFIYLDNQAKTIVVGENAPKETTHENKISPNDKKDLIINKSKADIKSLSIYPNLDEESKKSLVIFSTLAAEAVKGELTYKEFVQSLEDLELRPTQMLNENVHTGRMSIVRTQNVLPGVRYLHAQFFSKEGGSDQVYLQHISFELRASPDSFNMARDLMKKQFNITAAAKNSSANFISWDVGDRVVWVKKMSSEDLKAKDPYNSYDPKTDVGVVVITIEEEIH